MGTTSITVRPATVDDAPGIARVHVQAWREAYAHLLSAGFLADLDVDARAERWRGIIGDDVTDAFVAVHDDEIVGWASASDGRDADAPAPRELEGIYVLASTYGTGAGQALLDASVGGSDAYLWMADDNPRAESFYRRNGFARDGGRKTFPFTTEESMAAVRLVRSGG